MEGELIYAHYNEYWKKKLYENIAQTQKYIPIIFTAIMFLSSYFFTGELQLIFVILPILHYTVNNTIMLILEKKLIKNFENYAGIFIFALSTIIKIVLNYNFYKLDPSITFSFRMAESQYYNFVSWLYINNYKISFICGIMNLIIQIAFNYYFFGVIPDNHSLVDMACFCFYFVSLCYIAQQLNFQLFITPSAKLTEAVTELSRGMDIMSEHLVILNIDEGNNLSLYHSSAEFTNRYMNGSKEIVDPKGIFERFIYVSKYDIEGGLSCSKSYSSSLLKDLNNFIEENKRDQNVKYNKHIYAFSSQNTFDCKKNEYFEVKSTIMNASILGHQGYDQKSILLLIKNISSDSYQTKFRQVTDYANKVIAALTQEMKNPLEGLYGQLNLINIENKTNTIYKDLIEKVIDDDKLTFSCTKNENIKIKDYKTNTTLIENELDKYNTHCSMLDNSNVVAKVRSLLLCKYFYNIKKSIFNKSTKHFKSKLDLIISNYEIYFKSKLELTLNVKMNDINLSFLLNKCLKILYPIVEFNKNKLKLDVKIANFCLFKTDPYIFKILVKNIILLLEKQAKKTILEVRIDYNKMNENPENTLFQNNQNCKIHINFLAYNSKYIVSDTSEEDNESFNIIDVINNNNKILHKLIDCKFEESCNSNGTLRYTLIVPSCNLDKNMLYKQPIINDKINNIKEDLQAINNIKEDIQGSKNDLIFIKEDDNMTKYIQANTLNIPFLEENKYSHSDNNIKLSGLKKESSTGCSCFRVLVVDDDSLCISYMSNVVKKNNEIYELAYNGQEAYEKVKKLIDTNCQICDNKFLLIFMDIHMPVLNGVKSAVMIDDYLKLNKNGYRCKLYFTSANLDTQFTDIINKIDIYAGFMNKPIKKTDLVKVLQQDQY